MTDDTVKIYRHLYVREEFPLEHGYRMMAAPLPSWIYVTITEEKGSKWVRVYSTIHVNKEVLMHPCYSTEFTDKEILIDMSGKIYRDFID